MHKCMQVYGYTVCTSRHTEYSRQSALSRLTSYESGKHFLILLIQGPDIFAGKTRCKVQYASIIYIIIYAPYIYRQGYPKRGNDHRRGCKVRVYSQGTHVHTQVQYIICLTGHTSYYNCHDIDYHVEVESTESIHSGW